jgi:CBS domain-containing protein
MLKSIRVRDYMATHQLTFHADTDLYTAIDLLLEHRISAAPVIDEQGALIGLLTEIDCLRGILSGAYFEETGGTVSACMT